MAAPYFTREAHFTNPKGIDFTEKNRRLSSTNGGSFCVRCTKQLIVASDFGKEDRVKEGCDYSSLMKS